MTLDAIGWVRVFVPRYTARGQYDAMVTHNVRKAVQAGPVKSPLVPQGLTVVSGDRETLLRLLRQGTLVAVEHAHLIAEPSKRGKIGGTRQDFWDVLDAIEAKGAILWELYTGLSTFRKSERDQLTRGAIEALARGRHKARVSDKRGRPPKEFTPADWEKAERAWESRRLKTWDAVAEKLPKGMTTRRAWEKFGPRNVETTEET